MHYAAMRGHSDVVAYLIERGRGADLNARNNRGETALDLAQEGCLSEVRDLLEQARRSQG